MTYKGARYYKCDLQMQTPADSAHWEGDDLDIVNDPEGAALKYLQSCYESRLEVIGITDHNFRSKKFIPALMEASKKLSSSYGYAICILPGFEITAKIGKGVHALCLFEQNTDLEIIDHILTDCGVPMPRESSTGANRPASCDLQKLLEIIQKRNENGTLRGIVILPHSKSDAGIFDNDRVSEWLQQSEFTNSDLLCLEVPKSPSKMSPGWQKLFRNGKDCLAEWKRERPIACIMSSDAKAIAPSDGITNVIGNRFTWIKMSSPSIEGLRQAFLDHDSRVRRGDEYPTNPDDTYTHPYVKSIEISNAKFLADQKLTFGPNLNTIIGGRGTGKSTLVEYLRIALARKNELPHNLQVIVEGITSTLKVDSKLLLEYHKGAGFEQPFLLQSIGANEPVVVSSTPTQSIKDFFPVQILSKSQIEAIARSSSDQLKLIDDLVKTKLSDLQNQEKNIFIMLEGLNLKISKESELRVVKNSLDAQIQDLDAQITHIEQSSTFMKEWATWDAERLFFEEIKKSRDEIVTKIGEMPFVFNGLSSGTGNSPNQDWILKQAEKVRENIQTVKDAIALASNNFRASIDSLFKTPEFGVWEKNFESKKADFEKFSNELREKNIDPDQYREYKENISSKKQRLDDVKKDLEDIEKARITFNTALYNELRPLWNEQTQLRKTEAEKLNGQVPITESGKPSVLVSVVQFGDFKQFYDHVTKRYRGDGRRISDFDWEEFLKLVFDQARQKNESPSFILENFITTLRHGNTPEGSTFEPNDRKSVALLEWFKEQQLNDLKLFRTPDSVRIELYRMEDGSLVGDLDSNSLSAGQRATTILALTLARGNSPIIIDQPEDDLDNEFVYKQLVPLLRTRKESRQIIVVSHNANIPVNGDAELIVPLEVKSGKGKQKEHNGRSAVGALDRKEVQFCVEQIMEGSAEAFKKRKDKYGF